MKWFVGVNDIQELRKRYRELLKKNHPDNECGSVKTTQEINAEYDRLFEKLNRCIDREQPQCNKEENENFKHILSEIIGFNMDIEIIGSWIWCFNCYEYKETLKELGFTWCYKKKAWVWHDGKYRKRYKEEVPLSSIREKYGAEIIKNRVGFFEFLSPLIHT